MNDTASLFAQNRDEVMTPILPANVNSPAQQINMNAQPQGPQAFVAANDDAMEKQRLANDAIGVGQTLQNPGQGINAQSDASYLGNQVLGSSVKVATGLLSIISDENASADRDRNGIPDDMENKNTFTPAAPQPQMMSSPGFGMGGGPG